MGDTYRVSIRFNPEYDKTIIETMKTYSSRNLSRELRKIIRENLKSPEKAYALSDNKKEQKNMSDKLADKKETTTVKWNFPK